MRPTLHNLQALRGLACLLVVGYHMGGWEDAFWSKWRTFHPFRWFGYAGVDIFFVLSGFIIAWAHRDHLGQARRLPVYFARRFWRIYPLLWASSAVAMAIVAVAGTATIFEPNWLRDYAEWMLLVPRHDPYRFNGVTWSLYYEILFYLAFGLLFLVPKRWAGALLAAWAAVVVGAELAGVSPVAFWAKMPLNPLVLEFLGGTLVAGVVARGFTRGPRLALVLGLVWCAVAVALLRGPTPDTLGGSRWGRVLAFGPPCVLLVYAVVAGEITGRLHLPRRLRPVGDASYSIYLMHSPVALVLIHLTWGLNTTLWPHLLWVAILLGGGLGSGWLLHIAVERPLLRRKTKAAQTVQVETGGIRSIATHNS